jgi:two-component system, OmpR family, response regulator
LLRRSKTDKSKTGSSPADRGVTAVVVVNDDADVCELLCRVIVAKGMEAFRADSPETALATIEEHASSIGVVLLDFTGGTATSFSVLDQIRHRDELGDPAVVIIATTTANRALAFESGVDEFITRPFHADELTATLATVLGRTPEERTAFRAAQVEASETPPGPESGADESG